MSDDNQNSGLPALPNFNPIATVPEPETDISNEDLVKVNKFIEDGMPGLGLIDDAKMYQMMELYLSGKPYTQIAKAVRVNRTLLLYLSHKFKWYTVRRELLGELELSIRARLSEAKMVSQDFLLQLLHAWQTKIGKNVESYLATGDDIKLAQIDLKEVDKYLKIVEMIHKLGPEANKSRNKDDSPPGPSPVTINIGQGATISGGETVPTSPKEQSIANMLKTFADAKRAQEEIVVESKKKN